MAAKILAPMADVMPEDKLVDSANRTYKEHSQITSTLTTTEEPKSDKIPQMMAEMIEKKTITVTSKQSNQESFPV